MVLWYGLQMNQTRQFIENFVRHGPQKLSVQCGSGKNLVFYWFELYNLKRIELSKPQVSTHFGLFQII